jgi:integrase/recombinase XerD
VKCVINDQVVLSQAPDGPLAAHIRAFAESRTALGYARGSLQCQVRLAAGFSHWLKDQEVEFSRVGSDHASRYLRDRARRVRLASGMPRHSGTFWIFCAVRA